MDTWSQSMAEEANGDSRMRVEDVEGSHKLL